jgi:hypothetical protein
MDGIIMLKYTTEVAINRPISKVIELFDSFENLSKYQPNLKSYTHIEGTPGQPGGKTRLIYKGKERDMEMIETIKVRNFPDEYTQVYTVKGAKNIFKNKFIEISDEKTKWITQSIFKFKGSMAIKSLFMKKTFKKSTLMSMTMFKEFAENQ